MAFRFLVFAVVCAIGIGLAQTSHAESYSQKAFYFAKEHDWDNALIAAKRHSSALQTLVAWQYVTSASSDAEFDEIVSFMKSHPEWPERERMERRAEQAMLDSYTDHATILEWFEHRTPMTGAGQIALANALSSKGGNSARITELVRKGWEQGSFTSDQEKNILEKYSKILRQEDHVARVDYLLWDRNIGPANRTMPKVSDEYQKLFDARIALIQNKSAAGSLLAKVPRSLHNNEGLIYDRMTYKARRQDHAGVREMLASAPTTLRFPEKWWRYRERQIREAIDNKDYALAYKLTLRHGQKDGSGLADARWTKGWLLLEFLNKPREAYSDFTAMYNDVSYPISRARGAYWAGRAAEKMGDAQTAKDWYQIAGYYPTTFYGQMALYRLNGDTALSFSEPPSVASNIQNAFNKSDVARALTIAIEHDEDAIANRLIASYIADAKTNEEALAVSHFIEKLQQPFLQVRTSKKLAPRNITPLKTAYPIKNFGSNMHIGHEFVLAITRQESEFNPKAKSPAGALGLMQLMPGTARDMAKKQGVTYNVGHLYKQDYNVNLGSYYLSRMVDAQEGSYVLAIASYNAGPGNVRKWVQKLGHPGTNVDDVVNWIEKIPFAETRSYVQRVLENMQVYRALLKHDAKNEIAYDLIR